MAFICQGGRNSGLSGRFHCRLDSQIAPIQVYASRRSGSSGTSVTTYSYDPWGRMRDPQSLTPYSSTSQPSLLLGRGYCGHEHLSNYGLINMNARLYDPVLGRFLSPDPYVQSPDFSQNFNRYAYALNNPLKYTDESGEFLGTYFTATWRLPHAILHGIIFPLMALPFDRETSKEIFNDAWSDYGKKVSNAFKIDKGLYQTDENNRVGTIFSRNTSERFQTMLGNALSHIRNNFDDINVEYYNDATLVNKNDASSDREWGLTLGPYINSLNMTADPEYDAMFAHEYGHVLQSKYLGALYFPLVAPFSLVGCAVDGKTWSKHDHKNEWYEVWANQLSIEYFDNKKLSRVRINLLSNGYTVNHSPDPYFWFSLSCYLVLGFCVL